LDEERLEVAEFCGSGQGGSSAAPPGATTAATPTAIPTITTFSGFGATICDAFSGAANVAAAGRVVAGYRLATERLRRNAASSAIVLSEPAEVQSLERAQARQAQAQAQAQAQVQALQEATEKETRRRLEAGEHTGGFGKSLFNGVSWIASDQKWRVDGRRPGRAYGYLGQFEREVDAVWAHDTAERAHAHAHAQAQAQGQAQTPLQKLQRIQAIAAAQGRI
jgi:hypothetical protein